MEPHIEKEYLLFRNRIRRFAERLQVDENKAYRELGIKTPIRWMRVLHVLDSADIPLGITEIARQINRTHPDIHHITVQLSHEGLVKNVLDPNDQRRRLVTLTGKGKQLVQQLKPIWEATQDATTQWIFEQAPEFMIYLNSLEDSLNQRSYHDRIMDKIKENAAKNIIIKTFKKLPEEEKQIMQFYTDWQQSYQVIPELGNTLNNIRATIIKQGGQVFFAYEQDECVGLCVLKRLSYDIAQLLFIYVVPSARRRHVGSVLMESAVSFAKEIGCKQMITHIHRILVPVDQLLRQFHFALTRRLNKNYPPFQHLPHTMLLKL